jgi:hypothetical protein
MRSKTPFLTGFPTRLFGSSKRSAQAVLERQRRRLYRDSLGGVCLQLAEEIPPEFVSAVADTSRHRVYSQEVTFWAFLSQVLGEDGSCAKAVSEVQQWYRQGGLAAPSANTASYVEARQRLPEEMLRKIHRHLFAQLERHSSAAIRWRGHRVKAIDGTSAQMPDTGRNQMKYPQPSSQDPGCGFPVVQLVGLLDLNHGGWEDFVESDLKTSETEGFDQLFSCIGSGDILVGDRAYVSFEAVARLHHGDAHFVGRNHQSRKLDFRKGKKLGPNERLQVWRKPNWQTPGSKLSPEEWARLPDEIPVRIIRVKAIGRDGKAVTRYIVTTLLDAQRYPAEEVASLYVHRWEIELRFRDIKTTMKMEMLRTKSPEMIRKELMMHMIVYNALRLLMLKSAGLRGANHRRLSFKGALQVLGSTSSNFSNAGTKPRVLRRERSELMRRIAERVVPDRPGRNEPRKVKRRPKCSRWLQVPRHRHPEHFRYNDPPEKILDDLV